MAIDRSTPVAICVAIFLSLSLRTIEADSGDQPIGGVERSRLNLDDLVIEVTAPRGRERILNAEPFYERWRNVDDVAYWESIYGSADNIPEFEDLPEIAGETVELEYVAESENESFNAEDDKTSDIEVSERRTEKKCPPSEPADSNDRKGSSSDRCERINPLRPARRSSVRRKRETGATREESESDDPKRVARTLSRLRGEVGRSLPKSVLDYNDRSCDKHGRSYYRPYGFGHGSSSPCDRPLNDCALGRTESAGFVDSAINAESVTANSERCNVARAVADTAGNAGGQLAQAKRDAIDLGAAGRQAIGFGSVNNAETDSTEKGVSDGEARVDDGFDVVGNSVLDTNSGIINQYTETADGPGSSLDNGTEAAGIDTAVETLVNDDGDDVELVGENLEDEEASGADMDSEVSAESNSKLFDEEDFQEETGVTNNPPINEADAGNEARDVSHEDPSRLENNDDVNQSSLEEPEEVVTETPSDAEEDPSALEDKKIGNGEKSGGEEIVGSTLTINSDEAADAGPRGEEFSHDYESEELSCECRESSEEHYCYPREFYSRIFYPERPSLGDRYHEESEENPEYEQGLSAGRASTDIHVSASTQPDTATRLGAALSSVLSGPLANTGIETSLEEDVTANTDAFVGHSSAINEGSSDLGASRFSVRDENRRIYEDRTFDAASSEYDEYDEEHEYGGSLPEDTRGDESFSYRGTKSGIHDDSGTRRWLDSEYEINSAGSAADLRAEPYPARGSRLDIWPATLRVNGADPQRFRDAPSSGVRANGEIHGLSRSRCDVNAESQSRTAVESSTDLDSHLDRATEADRASAMKLGEKICEAACEGTSDPDSPDSRSDEAYDRRSEASEVEAAYHVCGNCRRELYGGSCPMCGRFDDGPAEKRRRFSSAGTIYHFDGPAQASAGAEITRTTRQLDRRINLDANCTGEAASHSLDCQGMDHELQTPRDGSPVPLRFVRAHLSRGHDIAVDMHDRARSLVAGGLRPSEHTASMLSFFQSRVSEDLVKLNEASEITLFGTKLLQHRLSVDYNVTPNTFIEFLDNHGFRVTGERICHGRRKRCGGHDNFRSLDGSCNNVQNPTWGQSNGAFARILPPRYSDGIHGMPVSVTGGELPNPRKLSVRLYSRRSNLDPELSLAVVQWGQTLAHDLARQVMDQTTKGGIECCGENGKRQLPRSLQHHSCAPISISPRDEFYSRHGQRCMNFVRSMTVAREDCTLGPADQLNGATSFLDCSPMYGVDKATSDELREFTGGRMKVEYRSGRWMLPTTRNRSSVCDIWTSDDVCYRSGDPRNNQNPQLVILQTLLVREHNRIADGLSALNVDWTDERIFQESRRIVIAEYQHITYNEWLPLVLGKRYAKRHGIVRKKPGMSRAYNELVNPSTIIGFTSGAFRSLHSMIEGEIGLCNVDGDFVENIRLSDHYFRPRIIEKDNNFEDLLRGLTTQRMQKQNMHLHTELTEYLFRSRNDYGMDLAAMDIQRGRDHGVPGYNAYRKICRLRPARDFEDLSDDISWENIEKLRRNYAHVDDIDLVVGATMENRIAGSQFGPTNRCIIGEQFYRSRMGDRYFYDNEGYSHSFTAEQFDEITKVTLSRLMCDMGGAVDVVQRYAFRAKSSKNPLVPCRDLPKLDLKLWIEQRSNA